MNADYKNPGAYVVDGPQDWQVFQRGADGTAQIALSGVFTPDPNLAAGVPCVVEARVVREDDGRPPRPECDWREARMSGTNWTITLTGVPTGGLYKIDTRLRQGNDPWRLTGDKIFHMAVGDLWALAGQSNSAGYGHGPAEDPPCLCVHAFGADLTWKLAMHPLHDTTRTTHPVNRDSGWVDHSPWLVFGRQIFRSSGVPVGLLPVALGGSPLSAWDPGEASPVLYTNMMDVVRRVGGKIAGMAWYQGESDAGPELAPTYAKRFERFVTLMRRDLGQPDLPVITVQLNRVEGSFVPLRDRWWGVVREAQRQVARTMRNVAVVPSLDLPLNDCVHTSAAGNIILGERCAKAALGMTYGHKLNYRAPNLARASFASPPTPSPSTERGQDAGCSPSPQSERGPGGEVIVLDFENVAGWLTPHAFPTPEFIVEDEKGEVPIAEVAVAGARVTLKLSRPVQGPTKVHGALSPDPRISLRDEDQRPILGFCDVAVK